MLATSIDISISQEHKDSIDISQNYLRCSNILVVCGAKIDESLKNDIAISERYRIPATTLNGILTVKSHSQKSSTRQQKGISDFARNIVKK